MPNQNWLDGVSAELREIHIPICTDCSQEYKLTLTTFDPDTQLGLAEYVAACNCSQNK